MSNHFTGLICRVTSKPSVWALATFCIRANVGGAHWMSTRGIVACSKDGEITNLQDKHIAIEVSGAAATLMREADGTRAIVAALTEHGSFAAGIGTWAQARIIRKGQT